LLELKNCPLIIWLCLLLCFCTGRANAQNRAPIQKGKIKKTVPASNSQKQAESTAITPTQSSPDTLLPKNSIAIATDSVLTDSIIADTTVQGDLQTQVKYTAVDSTIMDVNGKEVHLYKDAQVTYGTINLKADYIRLNWVTNEVFARGTYDSTSKKIVGDPVFQDGADSYTTKEIRYNFKTKKAFIRGVVTQQGDGNVRGDRVKKDTEGNMYIKGSIYTTCTLEHPHYFINAPRIKLVDKKSVVSGLFNLVISDVPLPIGLPFGFFPFPKNKESGTSGIIFPTYGEEPNGRGFFLRDGGYYFAINERVNAQVTGQIYSTGSWGLGVTSNYIKRYRYSGNFAFRFNKNKSGDEIDKLTGNSGRNDFNLVWSHSPVPRGNSTFSANVNMGSNSFNQYNAQETQRYISNIASSSVQYNRTFGQYGRAGASLRVNQNFGQNDPKTNRRKNGTTDVSTDFSFGVNQIAPFALSGGRGRWYESFRLGLDFNGSYAVSNTLTAIDTSYRTLGFKIVDRLDSSRINSPQIIPFGSDLGAMLGDAKFTGRYSLPISLPNFKILRYLNLTPSMSLQGEVFTKEYTYKYLGENRVDIDTLNRFGTEYSYSFGAGLNTRFYGMFHPKIGRMVAMRHTVIPSISFSYTPDFSNQGFERVQINGVRGSTKEQDYKLLSKYRGANINSGTSRSSGVVTFGINNQLEMKLKSKSDTADTQFEKVSLLDNLSIGGSYNLMADSLNLSNIAVNASTRIGKNLNMNFNMNFDPYSYIPDPVYKTNLTGIRINEFAVTNGQGLARLQNLNVSLGTSFNPKKKDAPKKTTPNATQAQMEFIDRNPDLYIDFDIPWNITLNYIFGVSRAGLQKSSIVQTVNMNGDLSLTPKWKISVNSGFDFAAFAPSITTLSLYRDLHCWDMNISWTPFAGSSVRASNYSFTLKVKSAILQDLKLTRRRSFYDQSGY
jgi:hypothetical protein